MEKKKSGRIAFASRTFSANSDALPLAVSSNCKLTSPSRKNANELDDIQANLLYRIRKIAFESEINVGPYEALSMTSLHANPLKAADCPDDVTCFGAQFLRHFFESWSLVIGGRSGKITGCLRIFLSFRRNRSGLRASCARMH